MSKKVKVKKPRATEVKTYGDQEKKENIFQSISRPKFRG